MVCLPVFVRQCPVRPDGRVSSCRSGFYPPAGIAAVESSPAVSKSSSKSFEQCKPRGSWLLLKLMLEAGLARTAEIHDEVDLPTRAEVDDVELPRVAKPRSPSLQARAAARPAERQVGATRDRGRSHPNRRVPPATAPAPAPGPSDSSRTRAPTAAPRSTAR